MARQLRSEDVIKHYAERVSVCRLGARLRGRRRRRGRRARRGASRLQRFSWNPRSPILASRPCRTRPACDVGSMYANYRRDRAGTRN